MTENKKWTNEEIEFLRENYLKFGNVELSKIIKRTPNAISQRLNRLNLGRSKEWVSKRMRKSNPMFNKKIAKRVGLTKKKKYASGENIHPMLGKKCPWNTKRLKENNPMKNPETVEKMRKTIKKLYKDGKKKPNIKKGETLKERYGIERAKEISEKLSKSKKGIFDGKDNPFYKQKHTKKTIKIIKEARAKQILPMKDSSIETKIQNFLKQLGIEFFTHQYMKIEHGYQCDILIPSMNLVIECDGDFIHCNPTKYSSNFVRYPSGKKVVTAKEVWERDRIRTKELIEKGFKILRLWENEIKIMGINNFKEKLNQKKNLVDM